MKTLYKMVLVLYWLVTFPITITFVGWLILLDTGWYDIHDYLKSKIEEKQQTNS